MHGRYFARWRFNSKLVRLKGSVQAGVSGICQSFNSKLVRLKAFSGRGLRGNSQACFNSKLVRLKVSYPVQDTQRLRAVFQFQTGSIKSLRGSTSSSATKSFNSKLVRLKGHCIGSCPARVQKFQFQTGSIKRRVSPATHAREACFNSKLVRLKDRSQFQAEREILRFNSKLVRLKV